MNRFLVIREAAASPCILDEVVRRLHFAWERRRDIFLTRQDSRAHVIQTLRVR